MLASLAAQRQTACPQCRRRGFDVWVWKITCRRKWLPIPGILAWEIPWIEEPGGIQSVSRRVEPDWGTRACMHWSNQMGNENRSFLDCCLTKASLLFQKASGPISTIYLKVESLIVVITLTVNQHYFLI